MSIYFGRVSTDPCFTLYIVSKQDQTSDIHFSELSIHLSSIHLERFDYSNSALWTLEDQASFVIIDTMVNSDEGK